MSRKSVDTEFYLLVFLDTIKFSKLICFTLKLGFFFLSLQPLSKCRNQPWAIKGVKSSVWQQTVRRYLCLRTPHRGRADPAAGKVEKVRPHAAHSAQRRKVPKARAGSLGCGSHALRKLLWTQRIIHGPRRAAMLQSPPVLLPLPFRRGYCVWV